MISSCKDMRYLISPNIVCLPVTYLSPFVLRWWRYEITVLETYFFVGVEILSIGFEDKPVDGNIIWLEIRIGCFLFPMSVCLVLDSTRFDEVLIFLPFPVDADFPEQDFLNGARCWDMVGTDSTSVISVLVESIWATERLYGAIK